MSHLKPFGAAYLQCVGAIYVAQALAGAAVGFTIPWLHYFGVL